MFMPRCRVSQAPERAAARPLVCGSAVAGADSTRPAFADRGRPLPRFDAERLEHSEWSGRLSSWYVVLFQQFQGRDQSWHEQSQDTIDPPDVREFVGIRKM